MQKKSSEISIGASLPASDRKKWEEEGGGEGGIINKSSVDLGPYKHFSNFLCLLWTLMVMLITRDNYVFEIIIRL